MAKHIIGLGIGEAWIRLLGSLLYKGSESNPRGMKTMEILNVTLEVKNTLDNIFVSSTRDLNFRFMIGEWLWIQAGLNDVNILAQYNSVMRKFSDDGEILSGAYGPRLMPQIPYIIEALGKEDSRQAVATIWTPSPGQSKDVPCTISLQWLLRKNRLHCTVNMRSSDVWLGLPYDYFTFSQLTNYIGMRIGKPVASLTMNLASSHIYEEHWGKGRQALADPWYQMRSPVIPTGDTPDSDTIKRMLNQESTQLDPFWDKYKKALSHDKSYALEVLHELDPSE